MTKSVTSKESDPALRRVASTASLAVALVLIVVFALAIASDGGPS
jgi:hypothetical protein